MTTHYFDDDNWQAVVDAVPINYQQRIMAPIEFNKVFKSILPYKCSFIFQPEDFSSIIVHKGRLEEFKLDFLQNVYQKLHFVFANEVFVVFSEHKVITESQENYLSHYQAYLSALIKLAQKANSESTKQMTYFVHLPRTGGTSIRRQLLQNIFKPWEVFPAQQYDELSRWEKYYAEEYGPLSEPLYTSYKFFGGHFGGWFIDRLIRSSVSSFTMLRDPVEQIVSFYQYFLQSVLAEHQKLIHDFPDDFQDLASFVNSPHAPFNQQTIVLGYDPGTIVDLNALIQTNKLSIGGIIPPCEQETLVERFQLAKKRLETCHVVGVTSKRDLFYTKLKEVYGWDLDPAVNINIANPVKYQPISIDHKLKEYIQEKQHLDYQLYDLALAMN